MRVAPYVIIVVSLWIIWRLRCRHTHPSLLPKTDDSPARWHCHDCGKTWDADFTRTTTPIQRFTGYDQAKAEAGAKRNGQTTAQLAERDRLERMKRPGALRKVSGQ